MNDTVIQVDSISKRYRLGVVGTGTLSHDLNRWWAQLRGQPDPYLKIGQKAESRKQKAEIKAETGGNSQLSSVTQPSALSLQPFPTIPILCGPCAMSRSRSSVARCLVLSAATNGVIVGDR